MDPLSHAALGGTLIASAPDTRQSRALIVAGTLGALSPDIDAVFMPFGWDVYLRIHEIGTHTIIGTVGCALLTAAVLRVFARSQPWWLIAAGAWVGAASHVLLDLVSSARLRVLWPIADAHASLPLVAMADPWLASILIAGSAATLVIRRHRRPIARLVLAGAAVFLVIKGVLATRALDTYATAADARAISGHVVQSRIVEARWAALSQWHIFDRVGDQLRVWRSSGTSPIAELVLTWPISAPTPRIAASRSLPTVRNFLRVHDLTFAATVEQPDGLEWIVWSDIRYCWDPDDGSAAKLEPIVGTSGTRLACALWFGGVFDRDGRARQQLVKLVGFTQTRPVE